ncbi:MAG TPA: toxin-antitoxin system HicB family antitoxin [Myxococcota bacterium]|nr:toxin-antitoxin system HicB family antitoxin [Myxococcota bacterium]
MTWFSRQRFRVVAGTSSPSTTRLRNNESVAPTCRHTSRTPSNNRGCQMSTLSLRLPNSLHEEIKRLARREGISINQLVSTAVAEKLAALMTEEHLEKRARRGSKQKFQRVLRKVRSGPLADEDRF